MNKLAKNCLERKYSYYDIVVISVIVGLAQHNLWFMLLLIPGGITSILLNNWYQKHLTVEEDNGAKI